MFAFPLFTYYNVNGIPAVKKHLITFLLNSEASFLKEYSWYSTAVRFFIHCVVQKLIDHAAETHYYVYLTLLRKSCLTNLVPRVFNLFMHAQFNGPIGKTCVNACH